MSPYYSDNGVTMTENAYERLAEGRHRVRGTDIRPAIESAVLSDRLPPEDSYSLWILWERCSRSALALEFLVSIPRDDPSSPLPVTPEQWDEAMEAIRPLVELLKTV